jgi:hypothetical protein
MKKISIIIAISIFFLSCGKDGEIGPKGKSGTNGTDGAKGDIGVKGGTGTAGAAGEAGKPANVEVYFSDWIPQSIYEKSSETGSEIFFKSENDYVPIIIPNYKKTSLTLFESLEELHVYDSNTNLLLGTLYTYNSFLDKDGKRIIFKDRFFDAGKKNTSLTLGFIDFVGSELVPSVSETNTIRYSKGSYPANTDFTALNKSLDSKNRFIFIPIGLPQKSGRVKKISTYEELLEAYGIPSFGKSK